MSAHLYTLIISQGRERWVGYGISENVDARYFSHKQNLNRAGFRLSNWTTFEAADIVSARAIENKIKRNTRSVDLRVDGFRCETAPIQQAKWIKQLIEDGIRQHEDELYREQRKNKWQEEARKAEEVRKAQEARKAEEARKAQERSRWKGTYEEHRAIVKEWFTKLSAKDQGLLANYYRKEFRHLCTETDDWSVIRGAMANVKNYQVESFKEKLAWCIADEARREKMRSDWNNSTIDRQTKEVQERIEELARQKSLEEPAKQIASPEPLSKQPPFAASDVAWGKDKTIPPKVPERGWNFTEGKAIACLNGSCALLFLANGIFGFGLMFLCFAAVAPLLFDN